MPKVLLIEDEESLGEALEYQLGREGYEVDRVTDGVTGLRRFSTAGADLVLLDLMLPGMAGEDVCKEIRRTSNVPIIMLTARDAEIDKVVGLEIGADDYVTKPFHTRELLARIKAVLRRATTDSSAPGGVLEAGGIRLDPERFEVTVNGGAVHMPRKEFELLEILMENAGRVLTRGDADRPHLGVRLLRRHTDARRPHQAPAGEVREGPALAGAPRHDPGPRLQVRPLSEAAQPKRPVT